MRNVRRPCSLTLPRSAVPHMSPSLPISPLRTESARTRLNTHQCLEIHRATSGKRASASERPADPEMHGSETNKDRRESETGEGFVFCHNKGVHYHYLARSYFLRALPSTLMPTSRSLLSKMQAASFIIRTTSRWAGAWPARGANESPSYPS